MTEETHCKMSLAAKLESNVADVGILSPFAYGAGVEIGEKLNKLSCLQSVCGLQLIVFKVVAPVGHPLILFVGNIVLYH